MTPETLQGHLRRQPFQPFRMFLSDGSTHDVRHPEMALLTRREVVLALPQNRKSFPERLARIIQEFREFLGLLEHLSC